MGDGRKRNHLALVIPKAQMQKVIGSHSERTVDLSIYFLDTSPVDKVINIITAEKNSKVRADFIDRKPQAGSLLIVKGDFILHVIFLPGRTDISDFGILESRRHELISRSNEFFMPKPCVILQFQSKPCACPKLDNGRRNHDKNRTAQVIGKTGAHPVCKSKNRLILVRTLRPIL